MKIRWLLKQCRNVRDISQTHALSVTTGLLQQDDLVLSYFIDVLSKFNLSSYAYSLFLFAQHNNNDNCNNNSYNKNSIYLYNTMIKALTQSQPEEAIALFNRIRHVGLSPDTYSFPFVLKAVIRLSALGLGRGLHSQTVKAGLDFDVHVVTSFIQMYSSCAGCLSDARKLFDGVNYANVAFWNAMVAGYTKVGDVDTARDLFERMPERNVISWTSVIAGYVQTGQSEEALMVFRRMQLEGVDPDEVAMLAALSACADLGVLDLGEWIHNYINKHGLVKTVPINNALIDMYAKSGNIEKALDVFQTTKSRTVITWTTMIAGLSRHGLAREALEMFCSMEKAGVKPNEITLMAVLSACSHVGMVDLGWSYFNTMESMYGIKPKIEHYGCIIDLLGRAGYLKEAQELVSTMPSEPNAAIWGSLLAASKVHGDAELGECALQHLVKLEPHHSGNYALLSNIYATFGRWNDSGTVRKAMRKASVRKMPGGSFIEVNNRVNEFIAGDSSHPLFDTVHEVLSQIDGHLKTTKHLETEYGGLLEG